MNKTFIEIYICIYICFKFKQLYMYILCIIVVKIEEKLVLDLIIK